jgi:AbrB family looped-hinge helix DNA binding protein
MMKVDAKGRVIIPKGLREKVKVKEGGYVKMRAEGGAIIIEPVDSIADRYYGAFKVERWPDDLAGFIVEVLRRWWASKAT